MSVIVLCTIETFIITEVINSYPEKIFKNYYLTPCKNILSVYVSGLNTIVLGISSKFIVPKRDSFEKFLSIIALHSLWKENDKTSKHLIEKFLVL